MTLTAVPPSTTGSPALSSQPEPQPGTQVVVYRPPPSQAALRVDQASRAFDEHMSAVYHGVSRKTRKVRVATRYWALPLVGGGAGAAGTFAVMGEMGLLGLCLAGVGMAASGVMRWLHPRAEQAALAKLPPVMSEEARTALHALASARTDFVSESDAKLDAPEVDVALAARAKHWLEHVRDLNDPELNDLLQRYASANVQLTDDERFRIALVDTLRDGGVYQGVVRDFLALPTDKQRDLAPFLREVAFDQDELKVRGSAKDAVALLKALEAVDPKGSYAFVVPPQAVPARVAGRRDMLVTIERLNTFQKMLNDKPRDGEVAFAHAMKAFKYATADDHTGIERAVMGTLAERVLARYDFDGTKAFRARAALDALVVYRDAEPDNVRADAKTLLEGIDALELPLDKVVILTRLGRNLLPEAKP